MNQARSEEEEKETGKTEDGKLMERKAAQQNKNLFEKLKQGLYLLTGLTVLFCIYFQGRGCNRKIIKIKDHKSSCFKILFPKSMESVLFT